MKMAVKKYHLIKPIMCEIVCLVAVIAGVHFFVVAVFAYYNLKKCKQRRKKNCLKMAKAKKK